MDIINKKINRKVINILRTKNSEFDNSSALVRNCHNDNHQNVKILLDADMTSRGELVQAMEIATLKSPKSLSLILRYDKKYIHQIFQDDIDNALCWATAHGPKKNIQFLLKFGAKPNNMTLEWAKKNNLLHLFK